MLLQIKDKIDPASLNEAINTLTREDVVVFINDGFSSLSVSMVEVQILVRLKKIKACYIYQEEDTINELTGTTSLDSILKRYPEFSQINMEELLNLYKQHHKIWSLKSLL